jgi:hypothetical protein
VSNQVEIIYSSSRNSKETGEIIRISPRKTARGIRPLGSLKLVKKYFVIQNFSHEMQIIFLPDEISISPRISKLY